MFEYQGVFYEKAGESGVFPGNYLIEACGTDNPRAAAVSFTVSLQAYNLDWPQLVKTAEFAGIHGAAVQQLR